MMKTEAKAYVQKYLDHLIEDIKALSIDQIIEVAEVLRTAQIQGKRIFIMGNGGSAAAAAHLTCDLGKNTRQPDQPRLRVISLVDNIAGLTAYANDEGYENVFSEPLLSLAEKGDVAIAISGSGNSPNVLKAMETAKQLGVITIGLTGFEGGKLRSMVDYCLVVPSHNMERIEDLHLILNHLFTGLIRNAVQFL